MEAHNHIKSCTCDKVACEYVLILFVSRIGAEAECVTEESCNKILLLANMDQANDSGHVSANVYQRIES